MERSYGGAKWIKNRRFFIHHSFFPAHLWTRSSSERYSTINLENRLLSYAESFNELGLGGMHVRMVSGGYQMVTDKDLLNELSPPYFGEKTEALSRASMETSAIIAYKQPITRIEIDEIRGGVNSSGTVRYLLEKNLIKVTGRKDVPGRPLLYSTTKYFLEYMGG